MKLTLLRHAAPPVKYHKRYIGHTDIPIDETLFEHRKIEYLLHQKFDLIYSSDLQRCTATLKTMGITSFITDSRLREVSFKPSFEGKNFSEIEGMDDFSPLSLNSQESWHRFICDEPIESFQGRIRHFLDELPREENILICTHGGTIGMILSVLKPEVFHPPLEYLEHITLSFG